MKASIIRASRPVCSRCFREVVAVVIFESRSVRDGKPVLNRGAARNVRLCRDCVRSLLTAFGGKA